ncbi:MAG: hypothetical protein LC687_03820, partial [Actinobacteria bacterium]|nr:hypothetical protein [Actinomycetota bacterium]
RIQHVMNWLLEGMSTGEVIKLGMDKWEISERMMFRYIANAREWIEAAAQQHAKGIAIRQLYKLEELYADAVKAGNIKEALDIIKTQNRMLGLNAPERLETASVEKFESMSMAEQLRYFGERFEKIAEQKKHQESRQDVN